MMSLKPRLPQSYKAVLFPLALLILPALALYQLRLDLRWVGTYILVVNLLTYLTYRRDKQCAEAGTWRVSEARLHLLELAGGWPAAFVAQKTLHHKCSKKSYLVIFWIIIALHQLLSMDALLDWHFSETLLDSIELILKQ